MLTICLSESTEPCVVGQLCKPSAQHARWTVTKDAETPFSVCDTHLVTAVKRFRDLGSWPPLREVVA